MSDLRTELDAELRALDIAPAPVADTMRAGRRLRHNRRITVAASVLAVAAIAAGVPVLTRAGAAPGPLPATRPTKSATATPTFGPPTLPDGDPVVTDVPPAGRARTGEIAQGTIGARTWQVTIGASGLRAGSYCYNVTGSAVSSPLPSLGLDCGPVQTSAAPATFESETSGTTDMTSGTVAADVAYLVLTFTDGQQLTLIPVTVDGYRLVAFVAPVSMTIASVTAHLGAAGHDNGQTSTAIPLSLPGKGPLFGLWQRPGQAPPPRATRVIASGTTDGKPWTLTAYEGPWGTCFVPDSANDSIMCWQSSRLATTELIGDWGGNPPEPEVVSGSAAPGVASVALKLDNGKTVTAVPVTVGNERLFAFLVGAGVSPTRWTAYSASGKVLRTGSV